ncbi:MAG: type I restriction enzyme HsdR N-terminal domain-containing protein [Rhabdochlamydiaceae bacterium]|nr:type I restriction enzyme HsdR N-terminal domain-containing protein [Rhabdochlamydiaceae bacterium]
MALSSRNKRLVFDEIRRQWVKATPEEIVRQTWIQRMIQQLGYPKQLLAVEKEIRELPHLEGLGVPERRVDLLCFMKGERIETLSPLLLFEFKEEVLDLAAIDQVIGYNYFVKAPFVAVANLKEVLLGSMDRKTQQYVFHKALPPFADLLKKELV